MNTKYDNILKIYIQKLKYFRYSERTISSYYHYVFKFLEYTGKYSQHLVSSDFQSYLDNFNFSSSSQQNQIISSIKFLYEKVLNKKYNKISFERPRKEKKLPRIIDKNLLANKINSIENLKHKAILSLAYCCALRVSEVINLKIDDVDSNRMLIHIRNAKGNKERYVPISESVLITLRRYYKLFLPNTYLFNGQFENIYSSSSCNKIVKKYLGFSYHFHLLRHSGLTHMLENGTDIRTLQVIAGHKNVNTTSIYCHVSKQLLSNVKLPI